MKFTGIIAVAKNRVIGAGDKLPWHYREDMKFFRETTQTRGGNIIMGHKTWKGMGVTHLKGRHLWVLMKENNYGWLQMFNDKLGASVNIVTDINNIPDMEYWVAGGKAVYEALMPRIDEFYVTNILKDYDGDVVMPEFEGAFQKKETILALPELEVVRLSEKKA
jgi:dihydrofolate reductase